MRHMVLPAYLYTAMTVAGIDRNVYLADFLKRAGDGLRYTYDLGDNFRCVPVDSAPPCTATGA